MTLEVVRVFRVPMDLAGETSRHLQEAGAVGAERFVLWSGQRQDHVFWVQTVHVPRQTAFRTGAGLMVHVDGDELHRLNLWLFENHQEIGVQVHSHPTEAYHSELDDTYPIATTRGALSIVVPDFAVRGLLGSGVAVYRLSEKGWDELSEATVRAVLHYEE